MDTSKLILLLAIGMVGMMLVQEWEKDYGQPVSVTVEQSAEQTDFDSTEGLPDLPLLEQTPTSVQSSQDNLISETVIPESSEQVSVITDVFNIQISSLGANIEKVSLLKYPKEHGETDNPLVLLDKSSSLFYIMQGGLRGKAELPTHKSNYSSSQKEYELLENKDSLEVDFYWQTDELKVIKTYTFYRDSYVIDIDYKVENLSEQAIKLAAYSQLQRSNPREGHKLLYTYTGAVLSTPEDPYAKWSFDDMDENDINTSASNGWIALLQHYFVSALYPAESDMNQQYYSIALNEKNRYFVGTMTPAIDLAPGASDVLSQKAYIGPKEQKRLEKVVPNLELVVDYGVLWFIAKPLFKALDWFHSLTGNWGWAIILVTIAIKLIFYPLSAAGYRSMANMRRVQPRLVSIRDRYKNDRTRLNQAMMDLYKEEKINPLGGCFPILIQIPVFIALYWVLLESVEMRQAPFMLWLQDLSSPDPIFVLPLLMGVTMFIQQKLNPPPMDPVQQKVLSFMPVMFTVFFAFFPSGLVLYWVSNNILSIVQQARINHTLEKAGLK